MPIALFLAGVCKIDALHGVYLLLLVGGLLWYTIQLYPAVRPGMPQKPMVCQTWRLRKLTNGEQALNGSYATVFRASCHVQRGLVALTFCVPATKHGSAT